MRCLLILAHPPRQPVRRALWRLRRRCAPGRHGVSCWPAPGGRPRPAEMGSDTNSQSASPWRW